MENSNHEEEGYEVCCPAPGVSTNRTTDTELETSPLLLRQG